MDESWEDMDPSDISALVAEVVDDYKRMGLELALLNIQGASSSDASEEKNSGSGGTGANGVKQKKERGRLNCLIIEMERVRRSNFILCFLFVCCVIFWFGPCSFCFTASAIVVFRVWWELQRQHQIHMWWHSQIQQHSMDI